MDSTGLITYPTPAAYAARGNLLDRDERMSSSELRLINAVKRRREMLNALGIVYMGASILPLQGGGTIGPLKHPNGDVLRWSLWAPAKKVLIDIFTTSMPPDAELELRRKFADEHALIYGVVAPGERLSLDKIKESL